jgi:hypothetical protein
VARYADRPAGRQPSGKFAPEGGGAGSARNDRAIAVECVM